MTASAVAATALVGVTATPAAAQASDFYDPPRRLPSENGAVIRSEPLQYELPLFDPETGQGIDIDAKRILYKSTNATGEAIAVSGVVLVPDTPWEGDGPRPIVGHGPGTWGIADHCATSVDLEDRGQNIPQLLGENYAVAVTDYEGLGTPGVHTYAVGQSQGRVLLDAVRAAINLGGLDVAADSPVAAAGYSQGGQTALWAGELQPSYAPELSLVAVAAGGAPGTLEAVAEAADGSPHFANTINAGLGFDAAYDELNLRYYLNWDGRALFRDARDNLCDDQYRRTAAGGTRATYMWRDPLENGDWIQRLWENSAGFRPMPVPMLYVHAQDDIFVPYPQGENLKNTYCVSGQGVQWHAPETGGHDGGADEYYRLTLPFLADMFSGDVDAIDFTCGR